MKTINQIPIADKPCSHHKMANATMGYVEHSNWMDEQAKKGLKQKQCLHCSRWLFPQEFNDYQDGSKKQFKLWLDRAFDRLNDDDILFILNNQVRRVKWLYHNNNKMTMVYGEKDVRFIIQRLQKQIAELRNARQ